MGAGGMVVVQTWAFSGLLSRNLIQVTMIGIYGKTTWLWDSGNLI